MATPQHLDNLNKFAGTCVTWQSAWWRNSNRNSHPEDGGSKVLRNTGIQPHYYTVLKPRRPRH